MNIALWVLQGLLAGLFLMIGFMKVFQYEKFKAQSGKDTPSKGLSAFIGVSEIAGALGLVLPWAIGVLPILTPVAATALAVVMILAIKHHLEHKHPLGKMVPALILFVLISLVAMGRF
jgi:uncharacterized membrane protein YphA (DoxX/SURF4 family)